jgi:hypothetical protein
MSESDHENVYERTYIMNEDLRQVARLRSRYLITGESHMPFEHWLAQHPTDQFSSLVQNGIRPLLGRNDYSLTVSLVEVGNRIAYWAWEVAVYHQTGRRRAISSNLTVGTPKSRSQYETYTEQITTLDWNQMFDEWENDLLFNDRTLEGAEQRNTLPDFLWKFVRDDGNGGSDYESTDEDESAPKNSKVKVSDLGWVTNNRRVF